MRVRISIRSAVLSMAVLCVALAVTTGLHRLSVTRIQNEKHLSYKLTASVDSVYFLSNGKVSAIDYCFTVFERDADVAPIGTCTLCFLGINNTFDLKLLTQFSSLTRLELSECKLSDEQWNEISQSPTIAVVEITAGTEISEYGRKALERGSIKLIEPPPGWH
jgi:hypothetical protein